MKEFIVKEYVKASDDVETVLDKYPSAVKFFSDKNIVCVQCGEPVWGSVKDIIEVKYDNVDEIIKELNEYLNENE